MSQEFIENSLVILTKPMLDMFLREENPSELISLYIFYYYTAKWQNTNQPKCTTDYASKGLHWAERKVRKVKKQLIELGLIEDVKQRDKSNKILGHYVKLKFIFKGSTEAEIHPCSLGQYGTEIHPCNFAQYGKSHSVDLSTTNALSTNNINALSTNNINALSTNIYSDSKKEHKKTSSEQAEKAPTQSKSTTNKNKKQVKHKYGEYKNVLLSDVEYEKLKVEFPNDYQERIETLSEYIASHGKTYKDFLATIRSWARREKATAQKRYSTNKYSANKDYSGGWD